MHIHHITFLLGFFVHFLFTPSLYAEEKLIVFEHKIYKNKVLDHDRNYVIHSLYSDLMVNDQRYRFLVDTGAAFITLNPKSTKVKNLGPLLEANENYNFSLHLNFRMDKGQTKFLALTIPTNKYKYAHFFNDTYPNSIKFDGFGSPTGSLVQDGIIVLDIEKGNMIGIQSPKEEVSDDLYDYAFRKLSLSRSHFTAYEYNKKYFNDHYWYVIDLFVKNHAFGGMVTYPFLIDTGATDVFVHEKLIHKTKMPIDEIGVSKVNTLYNEKKQKIALGADIEVGSKLISDIPIVIENEKRSHNEFMGTIGMSALQKAILILPTDSNFPMMIGYR